MNMSEITPCSLKEALSYLINRDFYRRRLAVKKLLVRIFSALVVFLLWPGETLLYPQGKPDQTIKIGLLIQDDRSVAAVNGAELAVIRANEKGGLNNHHFQLVFRSMEGPWGTGSKQAVDLIFDEKVWALLGLHDGRNAHLVEQAATKSTVVFISAWAGDPTLSQAFVPWFYNCFPNDLQQSASLIKEIYDKRKFSKVSVIYSNDYDSKMMQNNLVKLLRQSGKSDPSQFSYDNYSSDIEVLTDTLIRSSSECIVLLCRPKASLELLKLFKKNNITKPVYGSLAILNENELSANDLQNFDDLLFIPATIWSESEYQVFKREFLKTYNKIPGVVASQAYDAMNTLIEAIKKAGGPGREKIQKALGEIHHKGVTGIIQFDKKGNRNEKLNIMAVKNGIPVIPK